MKFLLVPFVAFIAIMAIWAFLEVLLKNVKVGIGGLFIVILLVFPPLLFLVIPLLLGLGFILWLRRLGNLN